MKSSKHKWTAGIYDDVSPILCDNPVIETIKAAPRIANPLPVSEPHFSPLGRANRSLGPHEHQP